MDTPYHPMAEGITTISSVVNVAGSRVATVTEVIIAHPGRSGVWPVVSGVSASTYIVILNSTSKHLYNCTCKCPNVVSWRSSMGDRYPINIGTFNGVRRCLSINVWAEGISVAILVCNRSATHTSVVNAVSVEVF